MFLRLLPLGEIQRYPVLDICSGLTCRVSAVIEISYFLFDYRFYFRWGLGDALYAADEFFEMPRHFFVHEKLGGAPPFLLRYRRFVEEFGGNFEKLNAAGHEEIMS